VNAAFYFEGSLDEKFITGKGLPAVFGQEAGIDSHVSRSFERRNPRMNQEG